MKTIAYKVDIQNDFCDENGTMYVPGVENIKENIQRLDRYPFDLTMGSGDSHDEDDVEFETFPKHCVTGTWGAKLAFGICEPNVFFEKKTYDVGNEPLFKKIYNEYVENDDTIVVYGVVTEICVDAFIKSAAKINKNVKFIVISDAIKELDPEKAETVKNEWVSGDTVVEFKTTDEFCGIYC